MFNVSVNGHVLIGIRADSADQALMLAIQMLGMDTEFNIDAYTTEQ